MPTAETIKGVVFEGGNATCLARVRGSDGAYITQATFGSIGRKIYDRAAPGTLIDSAAVTVATSVFDTRQTDDRWTADSAGYNFRDVIAGALLGDGDRTYMVEYLFSEGGASKPVYYVQFALRAIDILGV